MTTGSANFMEMPQMKQMKPYPRPTSCSRPSLPPSRVRLGRLLCALLLAASGLTQGQPREIVPASADTADAALPAITLNPGECWIYGAANPRPVRQLIEVQVKDSHAHIQVTPAEIRQGYKRVVTREGTLTYRIEPPTWRTVEERIMVRPPVEHFVVEPARFETQMRTVTLDSEHQRLEPCNEDRQASLPRSFCLQEHPAQVTEIPVEVMVKPETTRVVIEPAQYKTIRHQVIDRPARVIEVWHQPQEEVIPTQEVAMPAHTSQTLVPARTRTLERTRHEGKPRLLLRQGRL